MTDAVDRAPGTREVAILAGGCFWCIEAIFQELRGVETVTSGYTGGARANPTYEQVCSGATGHAEAVGITFDPAVISFADLLRVFFTLHDPTTLNRQGADMGTQYRSSIFYCSSEQEQTAREIIAEFEAAHVWRDPIITEVTPFNQFYPAEEYHDDYYQRNRSQPYCQMVISPKIAKLREKFRDRLQA